MRFLIAAVRVREIELRETSKVITDEDIIKVRAPCCASYCALSCGSSCVLCYGTRAMCHVLVEGCAVTYGF